MIEVSKEAVKENGHWLYWTWENGFEHGIKCSEQGWPIIGFDVTKEARATARERGFPL